MHGDIHDWMIDTGQIAGKLDDALTIGSAIDWLRNQHRSGRQFFLSLNLQTSHFPYELANKGNGPFAPAMIDFKSSAIGYPADKTPIVRNAYYNALAYIDQQIDRLMQALEDDGIRDQTIVAITGDHGEAFNEAGYSGHALMPLETVLKVGLVLNCPSSIHPGEEEYLAQSVDVVPTLIGLLGIGQHPAFQGIDLFSRTRPPNRERLLFIHCCNPLVDMDAVVTGNGWKYIVNRKSNRAKLLFQPTDFAKHADQSDANRAIAAELAETLEAWRLQQLLYYSRARYYVYYYPPRDVDTADETQKNALSID
jgi:arylsulfatase A-like enzyme